MRYFTVEKTSPERWGRRGKGERRFDGAADCGTTAFGESIMGTEKDVIRRLLTARLSGFAVVAQFEIIHRVGAENVGGMTTSRQKTI
jgi:hypothetical protein